MKRWIIGIASTAVTLAIAAPAYTSPVGANLTRYSGTTPADASATQSRAGEDIEFGDVQDDATLGTSSTGLADDGVIGRYAQPAKQMKPTTGDTGSGEQPVPEPATALLIGLGLAAMSGYRLRRR